MKTRILALTAVVFFADTALSQTLVACSCELANTVCLTDVEMSEHALHIQMESDRMGNHSNYRGVSVFQIGFDERGRVTGASAISPREHAPYFCTNVLHVDYERYLMCQFSLPAPRLTG
jgi:hypothetical protein